MARPASLPRLDLCQPDAIDPTAHSTTPPVIHPPKGLFSTETHQRSWTRDHYPPGLPDLLLMVPASTMVFSPPRLPTMDLPDRLPGTSMPPNTRSLSENPMAGRRPIPNSAATSNGPTGTPSLPTLRKAASSTNLSASNGLPPSQVISLARDAMRNALESENQVAEAGAVGASLKPGVTVDLSRKNIQKIPEEVVDILKNELER